MPVFTIKAKDVLSIVTVEHYIDECEKLGLTYQAEQCRLALNEIKRWRNENAELVKVPNHEHVPVMARSDKYSKNNVPYFPLAADA